MPTVIIQPIESQPSQPARFLLPGDAIDVWKIPVSVSETVGDYLSQEEIQRKNRFRNSGAAERFVAGRGATRRLVANYTGQSPTSIHIATGANGKPFIETPGVHFNITHAGEWILVALSQRELGIDLTIPSLEFDYNAILLRCFSPAEQKQVNEASDPSMKFSSLWCRKEALLKATGIGIHNKLHMVPATDGRYELNRELIGSGGDWRVDYFFEENKPIAVAYAGAPQAVNLFNWSL